MLRSKICLRILSKSWDSMIENQYSREGSGHICGSIRDGRLTYQQYERAAAASCYGDSNLHLRRHWECLLGSVVSWSWSSRPIPPVHMLSVQRHLGPIDFASTPGSPRCSLTRLSGGTNRRPFVTERAISHQLSDFRPDSPSKLYSDPPFPFT
jgi:hypothetical protein